MKLKHLAVIVLVAIATIPANAGLAVGSTEGGDVVSGVKAVNRYFKKRPTQKHAILSTGECAAGIAFSSNPAGAAAVGIPVLALGNLSAYLLRNAKPGAYTPNQDVVSIVNNAGRYVGKHPTLLQDASGSFCLAYGLTRSGRTKPTAKAKPTDPSDPTDPGDGGSGGGNGGGSGDGGGDGSGPPVKGPCTVHGGTDCGIGNGGINGGNNGKPPVTPPGQIGKL